MSASGLFKGSCMVIPLFLAGCAATSNFFEQGEDFLSRKEYDSALESFAKARVEDPENRAIGREMGIARYRKGETGDALPLLLEAFLMDTTDGRALFYLGMTYENLEDYPRAMDVYRRFLDVNPGDNMRSSIEGRITGLIRRQMEEDARSALAQEASLNPEKIPDSTVAVLYFRNTGKRKDLDPIQKGLADMIITDLSKVKRLGVVERVRMQKMVEEMGLGQTGLVDEATSPRMGKLLGASKLIQGSFTDLAKESVRLDAGFVRVKPGKDIKPQKIQGKMARFFQLEKDMVFGILDRMAVPLTQEEKDAIRVIPTENMLAFMAYCRALDYEDRGMFRESGQEYRKAAELDPDFRQAQEGAGRADRLTEAQMNVAMLEEAFIRETAGTGGAVSATASSATKGADDSKGSGTAAASAREEQGQARAEAAGGPVTAAAESPVIDQIMHTAGVLDQGFLPGIDARKPTQEENQSSFGNATSFFIRIALPAE